MARPGRLRVIAGEARGRRLVAPAGVTTRPMTDRVKESLFAALGDTRLADAAVLDLYAGSGALAIEALSRGAARAVLVERDRGALAAIERNLVATALGDRARVQPGAVETQLGRGPPPPEAPFDLAFLDPPYALPAADLEAVVTGLARPGWLSTGAVVVVRRPDAAARPALPASWTTTWERAYGDTLVTIATAEQSVREQ